MAAEASFKYKVGFGKPLIVTPSLWRHSYIHPCAAFSYRASSSGLWPANRICSYMMATPADRFCI